MSNSPQVDDLNEHLSLQVRAHRIRLGLTLREMDTILGLPHGAASRIERSEKRMDAKTLFRLATFLNVSEDVFFIGAPDPDVEPDSAITSTVPVSEVRTFLSVYSAIENKEARHELLALVRTVADSPHYTNAHDGAAEPPVQMKQSVS